jgi:uncharacterized damage-inducible protein DinB
MTASAGSLAPALAQVFEGWDGYQTSLIHAIEPLTNEQLAWRPAPHLRSVGELARHISLGRITWFRRMDAPRSAELAGRINEWAQDSDGNRHIIEDAIQITSDVSQLIYGLETTWQMTDSTLAAWSVTDLTTTYRHKWNGTNYTVSRQWTMWRIMAHDIHHGGEMSLMLGMQGIEAFELGALGGHITLPPTMEESVMAIKES